VKCLSGTKCKKYRSAGALFYWSYEFSINIMLRWSFCCEIWNCRNTYFKCL